MEDVVFVNIFYTEIVHNKGECDRAVSVTEESVGVAAWEVVCSQKDFLELTVCKSARFTEAVDSHSDFAVYAALGVGEVKELVFSNDFRWDDVKLKAILLVVL